jgi:hypothetical protein
MRSLPLLALSLVLSAPIAQAQTTPDSENGRYSFSSLPDGMLRLDTRTGQVSICARKDAGWACNTVPDERTALENEIARLQRELQLKVPLPGDAEIDRVMSAFEKMWRRLVDMVQKPPGSDKI